MAAGSILTQEPGAKMDIPVQEVSMKSNQSRGIELRDMGQLTLRANVVFAVRCAQRLRPCFKIPADASRRREKLAGTDGAIRVVAGAAAANLDGPARQALDVAAVAAACRHPPEGIGTIQPARDPLTRRC